MSLLRLVLACSWKISISIRIRISISISRISISISIRPRIRISISISRISISISIRRAYGRKGSKRASCGQFWYVPGPGPGPGAEGEGNKMRYGARKLSKTQAFSHIRAGMCEKY